MKTNDRRSSLQVIDANLDSVQMSSADRESARRQLRVADSVATAIARGIALMSGIASSARQR